MRQETNSDLLVQSSIDPIDKILENIEGTMENFQIRPNIQAINAMKLPTPEFVSPVFNEKYLKRDQVHEIWSPYFVESEAQTRTNLKIAEQEWDLMTNIL